MRKSHTCSTILAQCSLPYLCLSGVSCALHAVLFTWCALCEISDIAKCVLAFRFVSTSAPRIVKNLVSLLISWTQNVFTLFHTLFPFERSSLLYVLLCSYPVFCLGLWHCKPWQTHTVMPWQNLKLTNSHSDTPPKLWPIEFIQWYCSQTTTLWVHTVLLQPNLEMMNSLFNTATKPQPC
jgi:hypothetical protein